MLQYHEYQMWLVVISIHLSNVIKTSTAIIHF